jgi:hypothetical protein
MKNIIATFPAGTDTLTVHGLHQWDYGRQLEIRSDDLPAVVEVHFAHPGMQDAVVRVCDTVDNVAVAVIPDQCLEQTSPVTAWVYLIDDTAGATTKTVTLTVTPRKKPQPRSTVPSSFSNLYTEALTAMNEAVAGVKNGGIVPGRALHADTAAQADLATKATEANWALSADSAGDATRAESAVTDGNGNYFPDHYLHVGERTTEGGTSIVVRNERFNLFYVALDYADGSTVLDLGVVGIDPTRGDQTVVSMPAIVKNHVYNSPYMAIFAQFNRVGAYHDPVTGDTSKKAEWSATLYKIANDMTVTQYTDTSFKLKVTPLTTK